MQMSQKDGLSLWAGLCLTASHKVATGMQILRGEGRPRATSGNPGDYYLDLESTTLYGAKTDSGWGLGINLTTSQAHVASNIARSAVPGYHSATAFPICSDWCYANGFNEDDRAEVKVGYLHAPAISSALLKTGTVLVYMACENNICALPYTTEIGSKKLTVNFIPMPGRILITRLAPEGFPYNRFAACWKYKYIIIPGGFAAGNKQLPPGFTNYNAVCHYFGIPA